MYCLSCGKNDLSLNTEICPRCNAHLPSLNRDLLSPGCLLNRGKYRIEYPLGRGGFGVTYRAIHTDLDMPVAIKEFYPLEQAYRSEKKNALLVPKDNKEQFQKGIKHFLKEAKILNAIEHPNIVKVKDYFSENNTAYIVMSLVSGKTLSSEIKSKRNKRLSEPRVKEIVATLVDALATMHQAEIYHLDIKPDNILITEDNKLVLIDFGASKQGLGQATTRAFTLFYAPPELISGRTVGSFSDIFELGVMIYEMLAGKKPPNAVDRLGQDIWQPKDLQQPWRNLVGSALKLSEKERPADIRQWWENAFARSSFEAELTTAIPTIESQTENNLERQSIEFNNESITKLDITENEKNFMRRNLFKYAIAATGLSLVVMAPAILDALRSPLLVSQKSEIARPSRADKQVRYRDADIYHDRANLYYNLKKFDLALANYQKAIAIDPQDPYIYNNRGKLYRKLRKFDLALADFDRAIAINPNYAGAYNNRGNVYGNMRQWDLAIADYTKAIAINPNHIQAYNNRGIAHRNLNQWDLAIANYDKAIAINPNYIKAYNNRGIAYRNLNQWDLAIANYNKAIAINPNYIKAYNNRGNVYKDLKQWDLAIADYNKAIEINPNYVKAYNNRGRLWMKLGEQEKANRDLKTAADLLK